MILDRLPEMQTNDHEHGNPVSRGQPTKDNPIYIMTMRQHRLSIIRSNDDLVWIKASRSQPSNRNHQHELPAFATRSIDIQHRKSTPTLQMTRKTCRRPPSNATRTPSSSTWASRPWSILRTRRSPSHDQQKRHPFRFQHSSKSAEYSAHSVAILPIVQPLPLHPRCQLLTLPLRPPAPV